MHTIFFLRIAFTSIFVHLDSVTIGMTSYRIVRCAYKILLNLFLREASNSPSPYSPSSIHTPRISSERIDNSFQVMIIDLDIIPALHSRLSNVATIFSIVIQILFLCEHSQKIISKLQTWYFTEKSLPSSFINLYFNSPKKNLASDLN